MCPARERGRTPIPRLLASMLAAWAALPAMLDAQTDFRRLQQPAPPPYFAIQNARLVTVSGAVVEGGTIVMENGVISAVGRDVEIPASARAIDGSGLTVYPGLIDGLTTLGHPSGEGRGGDGDSHSWGPGDRPATTPWVSASDGLDPEDDRLEAWRDAGFTSAVTSPSEGFFPGQSALINLAGFRGRDMVVATPVGLRVNLRGGRGHSGYPNSLMGAIAYVRQTFLDAGHYGQAWSLYNQSPQGLERPGFDETLEPVSDALAENWPVLLPALNATEIRRAVRLGGELGLSTVVYGAQGAYDPDVALALARTGTDVLVSLDWPRRARNSDPEAEPALATLRLRERAPTTPAALAAEGVRFAFYSGGAGPADALDNARLAVAAGLAREDAIRALTLDAAGIFGVADRLGSLDEGKIANVVVTDGDIFDAGATVRMVFVDGHRYETDAEAADDRDDDDDEEDADAIEWTGVTPMTETGPYRTADAWFITNATIMDGTGRTIEGGDIVVRDGRIAEVGEDLAAPSGAEVIDAEGQWVIPGIIDAHSHIAAEAINEGSITVSSMVGIEDVIDPADVGIYRAAAGGVTTINLLHGSANPIGGMNAVLKMRWGGDEAELLLEGAVPGIKFALGENPSRTRNPARYPNTRMGVMDVIRQAFIEAREYMSAQARHEAAQARGERGIPPRRDLKLDALADILRGERQVHAHSYRADEILQLMRLAEEFGFRIATFQHVLEGYKVADELAAHGAGASTFSDWWGYKVEAYEAIPYNGALMTERGVLVSINSDSGEEMRHLNQEAAKAMKWGGLDEHEALALITMNPALQLGIEARVGSIEPGKDADLVIYDGYPLSILSKVEKTMIDGAIYFDREMDAERQRALEGEKRTLLEKQRDDDRPRAVTDAFMISPSPGGAR